MTEVPAEQNHDHLSRLTTEELSELFASFREATVCEKYSFLFMNIIGNY